VTRAGAVLNGALAQGEPSYDAVLAEHGPVRPGGDTCRACGFVYTDDDAVCPAVVLAEAGHAELADRVRPVAARDRGSRLDWIEVGVQRLDHRVHAIGARVETLVPRRSVTVVSALLAAAWAAWMIVVAVGVWR
jgi:hypothetical protein